MPRVTGIGGVFFKSKDPQALYEWYKKHLGIDFHPQGGGMFRWADDIDAEASTAWAIFKADTKYFGDGPQTFMLNLRVENLDSLLEALAKEGVWIDPKRDKADYGSFAWIRDLDGNRVELWEPVRKA
jgi:catechol 2,3-dioxygenase-like lactoylglutathione lyase family enzyme